MSILDQLIAERDRIVTDYGQLIPCREMTKDVSAFPGGSGFLDGEPSERTVMVVLHNYDGSENVLKPENYKNAFWLTLDIYLTEADVERTDVFLTNYYMGLRPGAAVGEMASLGGTMFLSQCRRFFDRQVQLINPCLVVVCGKNAHLALDDWRSRAKVTVAHPSSNRDATQRVRRATRWARSIKAALATACGPERLATNSVTAAR